MVSLSQTSWLNNDQKTTCTGGQSLNIHSNMSLLERERILHCVITPKRLFYKQLQA